MTKPAVVRGARRLLKQVERKLDEDWEYHDWPAEAVETVRRLTRKLRQVVGPDPRMSFEQWREQLKSYVAAHPEQRLGQAYFNSLGEVHPVLSRTLTGSDYDPFYKNERAEVFVRVVEQRWKDV